MSATGEHRAAGRDTSPSLRIREVVMTRTELKEIVSRIIDKMATTEDDTPANACVWGDDGCDVTTRYAIGEES